MRVALDVRRQRDRAPLRIEHEWQPCRRRHRLRLQQHADEEAVEHRDIQRIALLRNAREQLVERDDVGVGERAGKIVAMVGPVARRVSCRGAAG